MTTAIQARTQQTPMQQTDLTTSDSPDTSGGYRTPQMFVLGKAEKLVRRQMAGPHLDGTGGWYVWC